MRTSEGMTWEQIAGDLRSRKTGAPLDLFDPATVDRSLDVLLYHGLIHRVDEERFAVSGEIFKQWFIQNVLTDEERRDVSVSPEDERAALQKEQDQHKRNLYKLREQAAIYAAGATPLHLLNQIEAEEEEIRRIKVALENLAD
jgi:hypothetical protein